LGDEKLFCNSDKDYKMNESYDYFEIADKKGVRKKVMPLDGSF
jgi:hypothetical protein